MPATGPSPQLQPMGEDTPTSARNYPRPPRQQPSSRRHSSHHHKGDTSPPPWTVPAGLRPTLGPRAAPSPAGPSSYPKQQLPGHLLAAAARGDRRWSPTTTTRRPEPTAHRGKATTAAHNTQPAGTTTTAEAGQADGGPGETPVAELEEADAPEQGGRGQKPAPLPRRPWRSEDERQNAFKAAVQTAFGQRGWTKGEEVTWKEVAHLVGLREEDS